MSQLPLYSGRFSASCPGQRRGLSLVELLVVIAVLTLLVAILLPSLQKAREDARRTVCLANMKHIGAALFSYAAVHREDGPSIAPPMGKTSPRSLLSTPGRMVNLGLLWPRMIADPKEFYCPSQDQFVYGGRPEEFMQGLVSGSYAYAVHIPAEDSPRLSAIRHLAMASDDFVSGPDHQGIGRFSHRVGYNVLYTDGSVSWYPDVDGSIWKRAVYWDDETDNVTYASFYRKPGGSAYGSYGSKYDIFRVWHSFCYHRPDPF